MTKQLVVIGVDGMDWDVVMQFEHCLPNISSMMRANGYPRLRSVFPADTTPAWATIFTGLDPSEHGIINFLNIGDRENKYKPVEFSDEALKGRTFWDKLNEKGLKTAVLLPMNIKEGWDIQGLLITRPYKGRIRVWPEGKRSLYQPKEDVLGLDGKFSSEQKLDILYQDFLQKMNEEFRITKLAIQSEQYDLLFSYVSVIDGVQHDFWKHCDPAHPEYPGQTPFTSAIKDMYVKLDEFLGEIIELIPDTPMLIISDHGHGARPVKVARVNEMLKRGGYLVPVHPNGRKRSNSWKSVVRRTILRWIQRYGLPKSVVKLAKRVPVWKALFASSNEFDWERTTAYLSDLSALKNYSYGGIRVLGDVHHKDEKSSEIIALLKRIMIEHEERPLFKWIMRSNELYQGKMLNQYPEIIFQMDERYGADWNLGDQIYCDNGFMHTLSPGSHRQETAVIMSRNFVLDKKQYEMTDVFPLILAQLELKNS